MYTKIKQQFSKTTTTYDSNAIAQKEIVTKLFTLITSHLRTNITNNIFEFGCGTGNLSKLLCTLSTNVITLNDLYNNNINIIKQKVYKQFEYLHGDINTEIDKLISNNKRYNLIASSSTFQWIESPDTLLEKLNKILSTNGLLAISTFSPDNLLQIKQTLNIGLNYPSITELNNLFSKYFNILHIKEETINIYFNKTIDILKHLKLTGVNCLDNTNFNKSKLTEFNNSYKKYITIDNKYELTYKPIYIIATKK